jgi:hypothetical protein
MTAPDVQALVFGTVLGLVVAVVAVLALLVGVCVVFGFRKLRPSGPRTRVVRSLDEAVGSQAAYLGPEAPRGVIDQLRTPELRESAARKTG